VHLHKTSNHGVRLCPLAAAAAASAASQAGIGCVGASRMLAGDSSSVDAAAAPLLSLAAAGTGRLPLALHRSEEGSVLGLAAPQGHCLTDRLWGEGGGGSGDAKAALLGMCLILLSQVGAVPCVGLGVLLAAFCFAVVGVRTVLCAVGASPTHTTPNPTTTTHIVCLLCADLPTGYSSRAGDCRGPPHGRPRHSLPTPAHPSLCCLPALCCCWCSVHRLFKQAR
jgi:hypothetical protein